MSKILLINGSCHENGNTFTALDEVRRELERHGVETEIMWLGNGPVQDCIACGKCQQDGKMLCAFDDDGVNDILRRADTIDGIIVGSPIYYGGPSGRICSFLDRLFYAASGEKLTGKIGAAVVCCRRGGATAGFDRLNNYFLMSNMIVPSSGYWNQVHGRVPGDALQDAEGLQTMRTLAVNIAWILENMHGKGKPQYEERIATDFIRK